MRMYLTKWSLRQKTGLPIITAIGECDCIQAEPLLLYTAVQFIEKMEKFQGCPLGKEPTEKCNSAIKVEINVIFPTTDELNKFMRFLQENQNQ